MHLQVYCHLYLHFLHEIQWTYLQRAARVHLSPVTLEKILFGRGFCFLCCSYVLQGHQIFDQLLSLLCHQLSYVEPVG